MSEIHKILVLSSVYPQTGAECPTPVVHYFVKEWVAMGYEVEVVHTIKSYPKLYYSLVSPIRDALRTFVGHFIPGTVPHSGDEVIDGATVHHRTYMKFFPYAPLSKKAMKGAVDDVMQVIDNFRPDVVIAHWDNPQLQILTEVKKKKGLPTFLVLHGAEDTFLKKYGDEFSRMIQSLNALGFRSKPEKDRYEKQFGSVDNSFYAFSGVAQNFVDIPLSERDYDSTSRLIFVGGLIQRKYPDALAAAALEAFPDEDFQVTFIGEGKMKDTIIQRFGERLQGRARFTGKIPRHDLVSYLDNSDVFVMISEAEVFGLVYLEAMSRGCLTIASRGEGIDGIIVDGENGFLCDAGNSEELAGILRRIRGMSASQRAGISRKAIETARIYTDKKVAEDYIESVKSFI